MSGGIKIIVFLFFFLVLYSCSTRVNVPEEFPQEDSMAVILADIYIMEATMGQSQQYMMRGNEEELLKFYKDVFIKHNLTKQGYDTAFAWYSEHPDLLSEVYDKVISILNEKESIIRNDTAEIKKKPIGTTRVPKMKDIWTGKRSFVINPNDSTKGSLPFEIKVDSLKAGIFRLMATYRFTKGNLIDKANMKLIACYSDSTSDTVTYSIDKSFTERITTLSLDADKGKYVTVVKGLLLDHDTSVVAKGYIKGIKLFYIPRHDINF
jgi:hypothetical protein